MSKQSQRQEFQAVCEYAESRTSTGFVQIPFNVKELFGRARVPVLVTVNGYSYRSTVSVYGGNYYIPVNRKNRTAAGIEIGDEVAVTLEIDTEPRVVEVPEDVQRIFDSEKEVASRFHQFSYTHQREYIEWITGAKRSETRKRRIEKMLELIR